MYSSEDLERFYFQYQTEALPHGESLQSFCLKNKVPYNIFQKWFKDTRKKVVEVQVDGAPVITHEEKTKTDASLNLYQKAAMTTLSAYDMTAIRIISGYWSTRLRKRLYSSMSMAPAAVRYLQTSWATRN